MKNVHFKAIFRILPISIVENWNSAWIYKNTHISGSINATEMCQYFLESSDHGLQLAICPAAPVNPPVYYFYNLE